MPTSATRCGRIRGVLRQRLTPQAPKLEAAPPTEAVLADLGRRMVQAVDRVDGGIRGAPKFPQTQFFGFLWRAGLRYRLAEPLEAVALTLTHLAQGGIYDHLGGGFARYSIDERWLVPHFEKMLYDNAALIELMTQAWRETKSPLLAQRVEETVGWLLREMVTEGGGFAASLDADSEGEEGKFYVWRADEIEEVLGKDDTGVDDARLFSEVYDVTPQGNWEGHTILNRLRAPELRDTATEARLAAMRAKLLARRSERVRPGFDDKVLADWNGLMIAALADAADAFDRPDWLQAAEGAFTFICTRMMSDGRLVHAFRDGTAKAPASASDYANMIRAGLALASATGNAAYLTQAIAWTDVLDRHYWSDELTGYYFAADDTSDLILRPFATEDDATPNANAVMVSNLMALALWTGEARYRDRAEAMVQAFAGKIAGNVVGHAGLLSAAMDVIGPAMIVLIVPKGANCTRIAPRAQPCVAAGRGGAGDRRGRGAAAELARARQGHAARQAHRFRVYRPAMLAAGYRTRRAHRGGEPRAARGAGRNPDGLAQENADEVDAARLRLRGYAHPDQFDFRQSR